MYGIAVVIESLTNALIDADPAQAAVLIENYSHVYDALIDGTEDVEQSYWLVDALVQYLDIAGVKSVPMDVKYEW